MGLIDKYKQNFLEHHKIKLNGLSTRSRKILEDFMYNQYQYEFYHDDIYDNWGFEGTPDGKSFIRVLEYVSSLERKNEKNIEFVARLCDLKFKDGFMVCISDLEGLLPALDVLYDEVDLNPENYDLLIKLIETKPKEMYAYEFLEIFKTEYIKKIRENPNAPARAIHELITFEHPDYKLVRYIGCGANKNVFLARNKHYPEDEVALKLFDLEDVLLYLKERNNVEDFDFLKHENRAAKLSRENSNEINPVRFIQTLLGNKHMVVEDLFEMTLEDLVEKKGRLPVQVATQIGGEILNGLLVFHSNGMYHGDLKPANIGITKDGKIKLTDAGYATTFRCDKESFYFGGLSTRAPELYSFNGELVKPTIESDLWSFGVTMYYMLTGEYPFYRGTKEEKKENYKEYERKVYEDIRTNINKIKKNLNEKVIEKLDNNFGDSKQLLYKALKVSTKFIYVCLNLKPEDRHNSLYLKEILTSSPITPYRFRFIRKGGLASFIKE